MHTHTHTRTQAQINSVQQHLTRMTCEYNYICERERANAYVTAAACTSSRAWSEKLLKVIGDMTEGLTSTWDIWRRNSNKPPGERAVQCLHSLLGKIVRTDVQKSQTFFGNISRNLTKHKEFYGEHFMDIAPERLSRAGNVYGSNRLLGPTVWEPTPPDTRPSFADTVKTALGIHTPLCTLYITHTHTLTTHTHTDTYTHTQINYRRRRRR